ncbi:very short patch repair endonuclease [Chryseobacterium sp. LC2016-27]|uniref:very short patch repair endonuclease n=1 Tax=Chryseobacterium sp. LC2016-27 TaxID=2897326 RepID=UPI001E471F79|nr:very short patch repair endonuclease [Chryseobacterium sp. LC2016-27]MCD0455110.1 very short patch repair endonuclease [Chryseobacterium sp. LC2016-27]
MKEKEYSRDKRSPVPSNKNISKIMSHNKAKNTRPELLVRKAFWKNGFKGYRLHPKNIPGKPDIAFIKKKIAIFVNGCYWHRCPICNYSIPKSNTEFWENKFSKNVERDKKKINELEILGWKVITIWECELKSSSYQNILLKLQKVFT